MTLNWCTPDRNKRMTCRFVLMESSQKISLRFQSRPPPPPPGGVIFQDGFESGSSSAWTEVDGEGDLNMTAAAALNGTFGLAALIDNNGNPASSITLQDRDGILLKKN